MNLNRNIPLWLAAGALLVLGCGQDAPLAPDAPETSVPGTLSPATAAVLAAPTNLVAKANSASAITLTWSDKSSNEVGFEVWRSMSGPTGTYSLHTTTGANVKTWKDTGLTTVTMYCYQVRAVGGTGVTPSDFSSASCATTLLKTPTNFVATLSAPRAVLLTWSDKSTGEAGFEVWRSTTGSSGTYTLLVTAPANTTYANDDMGLDGGVQYCYKVRVLGTTTLPTSLFSTVSCATTPITLANGHMYFVAHEDDDLLFMNPDIQAAIAAGQYVTTVYLTAGACAGQTGYYPTREAGVRAAYARMAGVADAWTVTGRPIRQVTLTAQPKVSLVFLRLSGSKSEAGNICDLATTNLRGLWENGVSNPALAMTSLDGANTYTRSQLITALTELIQRWHPVRIGTADGSGLFGQGTDPSGAKITYPAQNRCYYYDHSDHYYSALFARAARDAYPDAHTFARYRAYNMANEAANVTGAALTLKQSVFQTYAEHDRDVPDTPPFGGLYDPWLPRQYDADASPAPVQPLCP